MESPNGQEILRFEPGTMIAGRYEVVDSLGQGGMGAVLKVIDRALDNELVALKLLYPHLVKDPTTFARFRNEVLVARQLAHPNIVRLYDFGNAGMGYYYIVMEYVPGESLSRKIYKSRHERPSFEQSLRYLYEIALALSHAHKKGVVHRDLKPDNVLINQEGELKLTDFGLARSLYVDKGFTDTGEAVGTPYYMAPEQVRGERVDARCDVYALGILAFELVVGRKPFDADCWFNLAAQHLMEPIPPFANKQNGIPKWFEEFVLICTAKNPDERFHSMEEVLEVLAENMDFGKSEARLPAIFKFYPAGVERRRRPSKGAWWKNLLWAAVGAAVAGVAVMALQNQGSKAWSGALDKLHALQVDLKSAEQREEEASAEREVTLFELLAAGDIAGARRAIERGASIDLRDPSGRTPLFAAVQSGKPAAVEFLLDRGAAINAQDDAGQTPVMLAAANGRLEVLEIFVRRGADLQRHDYAGKTAFEMAAAEARDYLLALQNVGGGAVVPAANALSPVSLATSANAPQKLTTLRVMGEVNPSWERSARGLRLATVEVVVRNAGEETAEQVEVYAQIPGGREVKLRGPTELMRNTVSSYYAEPDEAVTGAAKLKARVVCANCR